MVAEEPIINAKYRKRGSYGPFKVISNVTIPCSAYDFPFNFNRNHESTVIPFSRNSKYLSEVADFNLLQLHLVPHKEGPRLNFAEMFGTRKLESLGYCYANGKHWCSGCRVSPDPAGGLQRSPDSQHNPRFSHFSKTLTHNRETDTVILCIEQKNCLVAFCDTNWSSQNQQKILVHYSPRDNM